jgi:UDP-N-acetylmuramate--alanine ligase
METPTDFNLDLSRAQRLHFAGIGGIGMSALARYFRTRGLHITGYDRTETELTRKLTNEGIEVTYTPREDWATAADAVIYTPAVGEQFAELTAARAQGLPVVKRAAVLGAITRLQRTLAVAGTHGKTSTSSILATLLHESGKGCTALVGGVMSAYGSNFIMGDEDADLVVVEADEFDRSFLHLSPWLGILTSLDPDHLDIYGTPQAVAEAYQAFVNRIQPGGYLLLHAALAGRIVPPQGVNLYLYGLEEDFTHPLPEHYAILKVEKQEGITQWLTLTGALGTLHKLQLPFPGAHNSRNACAALAAALLAGVSAERIGPALAKFRGIRRRFEVWLDEPQVALIDDYAHHPTELQAAIATARACYPHRPLLVVFQPHLFTRTRDFYPGFAQSLSAADIVLLTEIYPARELSIPHVTSDLIFQHVNSPRKELLTLNNLPKSLQKYLNGPISVLITGAGDIDTLLPEIRDTLWKTYTPPE